MPDYDIQAMLKVSREEQENLEGRGVVEEEAAEVEERKFINKMVRRVRWQREKVGSKRGTRGRRGREGVRGGR